MYPGNGSAPGTQVPWELSGARNAGAQELTGARNAGAWNGSAPGTQGLCACDPGLSGALRADMPSAICFHGALNCYIY